MHAVHFHYHAIHPAHLSDPEGDNDFLASCISVADALANMGDVNIFGAAQVAGSLDPLPEWKHLAQFFDCRGLELDLREEIEKAATEMTFLPESLSEDSSLSTFIFGRMV